MIAENSDLQIFQYEMILEARRRPELGVSVRKLYSSYVSAPSDGLRRIGVDTGAGTAGGSLRGPGWAGPPASCRGGSLGS
ncbi:hypothetical protein [Paenarthrobacter nicotinovorans]|uniref:hypothetical protein n=1 Tax=Paenarthrobacter TaxID=1742992 RepID=UPI003DA59605